MNYEAAYNELQQIIESLDNESISITDLPSKVERAGELIKFCKNELRGIEQNLSIMLYDDEEE